MDITHSKIVISTHYLVYGAPQALREYLINKRAERLLFVAHPLETKNGHSYRELIEEGKLTQKRESLLRTNISLVNYLIEVFLTFMWVLSSNQRYDVFVGVDNLNVFTGLMLRALGRVQSVVYYTIDYSPQRFKNRLLNFIYHRIDYACVKRADLVWNVSPRIEVARKAKWGKDLGNQKVVPIGIWSDRIKKRSFSEIKRHQLLFLGHLLEKSGVQLVIDAVPSIIKHIPNFQFLIVGGGPYQSTLEKQATQLGLNRHITFTGWIKDRKKLDTFISESACAVAMYNPANAGWTYYADPTKLKDYLSAGLPIILTNVTHNAWEIERRNCGVIVDYEKENLAAAVVNLMRNDQRLRLYRNNALQYAKEFDWNLIFDRALGNVEVKTGA